MAQSNNINSVPFFPDTRSSRLSEQNNKAEVNNKNNSDSHSTFDKSFSSALNTKKALPPQAKSQKTMIDKPKAQTLFHPEPIAHRPLSLAEAHASGPALDHLEEVHSSQLEHPIVQTQAVRSAVASNKNDEEKDQDQDINTPIDDRRGVMNESYERSAVSYPVRRIANESIDEDTKESLKEKGLWDVPTMFAAQPTQKTMDMAEVVEKAPKESKVPVQKPIAQFMASLENELGVTHDQLVTAFQNLPPGTLQQSPRETMTEVVKQLNLSGEDEGKAVQLYSKMLAQMEMLDKPEQAPKAFATLAGAGALGGQFKDIEEEKPTTGSRVVSKEVAAKYSQSAGRAQGQATGQASRQASEASGPTVAQARAPHSGNLEKVDESQGQTQGKELVKDTLIGDQFKGLSVKEQESIDQRQSQSSSQGGLTATVLAGKQAGGAKLQDEAKIPVKGAGEAKVQGVGTKSIHSLTDSQVNSLVGKVDNIPSQDSKSLGALGVSGGAGASKTQDGGTKLETIQSIVKNAQLLASKGGGEMHMILKPEHLGEIHMRIVMDGQKVDVQMTTEKSEVKKLIEQSVHELKHGLASHDLNMEKLNVTLSNKNTQNEFQQGQKDFAQAREFAQQFHSQNQARREMAEFEVSNSPGNSNKNLSSRAENASRMMMSQVGTRGPGRLNVVA